MEGADLANPHFHPGEVAWSGGRTTEDDRINLEGKSLSVKAIKNKKKNHHNNRASNYKFHLTLPEQEQNVLFLKGFILKPESHLDFFL